MPHEYLHEGEASARASGCFLYRWRRFAAILSVVMMLVTFSGTLVPPKPAEGVIFVTVAAFLVALGLASGYVADAEVLQKWKDNLQTAMDWLDKYTKIFTLWKEIKKLFGDELDETESDVLAAGEAKVTADQTQTEALLRAKDVSDNNATLNAQDQGLARIAGKYSSPEASNQLLCNMIIVRQLGVILEPFKDLIKNFIKHTITLAWMGPNAPGRGPAYVKQMWDMTCGNWQGGKDTPTGMSLLQMPDGCVPTGSETDTLGGYGFEGATARNVTLDTPLTLPYLTPSDASVGTNGSIQIMNVTLDDDAPDLYAQKRWLNAVYACLREAGGRPLYPSPDMLTTNAGMNAATQYKRCAVKQSDFADTCAERIAFITRPNCKSDDTSGFCYMGRFACGAFVASGVLPPTSFDNCRRGLSLLEALTMLDKVCLSSQYAIDVLNAGKNHGKASEDISFCATIHAKLVALKNDLDMQRAAGTKIAENIDGCWAEFDVQKKIAEAELQKRYLAEKEKQNNKAAAAQSYRRPVSLHGSHKTDPTLEKRSQDPAPAAVGVQ